MTADAVRFVLDDRLVEVRGPAPATTLLDWLREHAGRCGTREGCAEGDCGACTVVLARRAGGRLRLRPVNACLCLLPAVDGAELITVESLRAPDGRLHPVQQALADAHGAQCGFCTPGFVMSLYALYRSGERPDRAAAVRALAGNLCRCTGYRPILDAAQAMFDLPADARDAAGADAGRTARLRPLERPHGLVYRADGGLWLAPRTSAELAAALAAHPTATVIAGGTDLGVAVNQQGLRPAVLISVAAVAELATVRTDADGTLALGAAVPLDDAFAALLGPYPEFAELAERFASPPVRANGTLGGNLANASPVGDAAPLLLALDAALDLLGPAGTRRLALADFFTGYRRTALAHGEVIAAVRVPPRPAGLRLAAYKVAKRREQDIAAVSMALAFEAAADGSIRRARLAYGGMAAVPARAPRAEAALAGRPWTAATLHAAQAALAQDYDPCSDVRAGADYRRAVAANLLTRAWLERRPGRDPAVPLRLEAL